MDHLKTELTTIRFNYCSKAWGGCKWYFILLAPFAMISVNNFASITLDEAINQARRFSPAIQGQEQKISESRELLRQAYGALLPRVELRANQFSRDEIGPFDPGTTQRFVGLNVSQEFFNIAKEYEVIKSFHGNYEIEETRLNQVEREMSEQVIESYYKILTLQKDEANYQKQIKILEEMVKEFTAQAKIGRARESEILLARTQVMNAQINLQTTQREMNAQWLTFGQLTGIQTLEKKLTNPPALTIHLKKLEDYTQKISYLPEMKITQQQIEVAQGQVKAARWDHVPKVNFQGNYYMYRKGFFVNDMRWDASVSLVIPLFEGGVTQSKVREAVVQKNAASIEKFDRELSLKREITDLYQGIEQDLTRLSFIQETLTLSQRNYELQKKEKSLGLVTNLDVLQALNSYIETRITYNRVKLETERNYRILKIKLGEI